MEGRLVTWVLLPTWVEVEHLLLYREDTMTLIEVCKFILLIVWEELILEMTETDHIVTTPVLVKQLTAALIVDIVQCRHAVDLRCLSISANLVEKLCCAWAASTYRLA